jgi:hypothetical protein
VVPPVLLPAELQDRGILLRQSGPREPTVKFALRHGVQMSVRVVDALFAQLQAKLPRGGKTTKFCKLQAMVKQVFESEGEDVVHSIMERFIETEHNKSSAVDPHLLEAFEHMDADDLKHFEDIEIDMKEKVRTQRGTAKQKLRSAATSTSSSREARDGDAAEQPPTRKRQKTSAEDDKRSGRLRGPTMHHTADLFSHLLPKDTR